MIRTKIIIFLLSIIFSLNNCGYAPQYAKDKELNFSMEIANLSGDRDFNNSLKSKLNRYSIKKENQIRNFKIYINSDYEKNTSLKDSSGAATEYELKITVNFNISYHDNQKKITFKETFNMKKMGDTFEERNYEKTIKNSFADIIKEKLIFYLMRL